MRQVIHQYDDEVRQIVLEITRNSLRGHKHEQHVDRVYAEVIKCIEAGMAEVVAYDGVITVELVKH